MLGHMIIRQLSADADLDILCTTRLGECGCARFDVAAGRSRLSALLDRFRPVDWVVNCVAMLQHGFITGDPRTKDLGVEINTEFPRRLAEETETRGIRVVHFSTDAVFAPLSGVCTESTPPNPADDYGRSKLGGEVGASHVLNLRLSVIGPDPHHMRGLFEWVRSQSRGSTVQGFVDQLWVGATSMQVARLCGELTKQGLFDEARREGPVHHFCPIKPMTKWDLICGLAETLDREIDVVKVYSGKPVTRQLDSQYKSLANRLGKYGPVNVPLRELTAASAN
jgi:dTDP-4-dehydrorhamnose reductase